MMRVGALCAGYGGLEMGLAQVIDCEPAWFCEFADGPSKILAHRYPGVPNHRDLTATDWDTVEPVDIVTAGWPCQPWSIAGARKGADDERAIWPVIAGAIRLLRPRYVCLENVSAVVAAGELARAVGDLAACGYDAQWVCIRASDVGAPHRRERIFILATDARGEAVDQRAGLRQDDSCGQWWPRPNDSDLIASNPGREHGQRRPNAINGSTCAWSTSDQPERSTPNAPYAHGERLEVTGASGCRPQQPKPKSHSIPATDWGPYAAAIRRWELVIGRPAPAPTESGPRGGQRLSSALVEFLMGLPAGWVTGVPGLSRNEHLKALGNGVVPQQAAAAFTHLFQVAEVAA